MKIKIDYLDNKINIMDDYITVVEIENKEYFYRIVKDFYNIEKSNEPLNTVFLDDNGRELNMNGKVKIYVNYFEFDLNSKKISNDLHKFLANSIQEKDKLNLEKQYKKVIDLFKNIFNDIDLPLTVDENNNIEAILKFLKVGCKIQNNILDNLFSLIDIENILQLNNLMIFLNLKQYLSNLELIELYKYSIYNKVKILLIDSQCYGCTQKFEKKFIIDDNLEEIVL